MTKDLEFLIRKKINFFNLKNFFLPPEFFSPLGGVVRQFIEFAIANRARLADDRADDSSVDDVISATSRAFCVRRFAGLDLIDSSGAEFRLRPDFRPPFAARFEVSPPLR